MPSRRCIILAALAAATAGTTAAQATIPPSHLIIAHSNKPGGIWDPLNHTGRALATEAVTEVLERRAGFALRFEALPWLRAQAAVRDGMADAMLAPPTAERLTYCQATTLPLLTLPRGIVYAEGSANRQILERAVGLADLKDLAYVYNRLDATESARARIFPNAIATADDASTMQMLSSGRGDFTIVNFALRPNQLMATESKAVAPNSPLIYRLMAGLEPIQQHLLVRRTLPGFEEAMTWIETATTEATFDGTLAQIVRTALASNVPIR